MGKINSDDYEIFLIDKKNNKLLSLKNDEIYFFNTVNFENKDFINLENNNFDELINNGLALRFDTEMIYRMYLGFVNKNRCYECEKRFGDIETSGGFGSLPV